MKSIKVVLISILFIAFINFIITPITGNRILSAPGFSIIDGDIEAIHIDIEWSVRARRFGIGNPVFSGSIEITYDEHTRRLYYDLNTPPSVSYLGDFSTASSMLFDTNLNHFIGATIFFDTDFKNWVLRLDREYIVFSGTNESVHEILELFGLEIFE